MSQATGPEAEEGQCIKMRLGDGMQLPSLGTFQSNL